MNDIDEDARIIFSYMTVNKPVRKADIIIGHGCLDIRVAERAAQLWLDGYGKRLLFTGGLGKVTKYTNTRSEAETFRDVALTMGIPEGAILLETSSSYTVENITNTITLLQNNHIMPASLIAVTKTYMERRLYATYMKLWPNAKDTDIMITSPKLSYDQQVNDRVTKDMFINVMVGDLQRIKEFPTRGFQIEQEIPNDVWSAYERLVAAGFTMHLIDF